MLTLGGHDRTIERKMCAPYAYFERFRLVQTRHHDAESQGRENDLRWVAIFCCIYTTDLMRSEVFSFVRGVRRGIWENRVP